MPRLQPNEIHHRDFDFIIIGGGTAGCVLANRLSCGKEHTVLVLEAGTVTQQDLLEVQIPLLNSKLKNTEQDWQLKSVLQANVDDRSIAVPLGKLLGGSSAFNACIYHRCSPSDYDAWNAKGWSYQDLQPYFRKAETFHDNEKEEVDTSVHGTQGPLHATHINKSTQLGSCFKRACKNYGLKEYRDMTDLTCQIGVTGLDASIYQGHRSSAGSSYLSREFEAQQSNLFIGLGCKVTRLIMQDNNVVGVEYTNDGKVYTVNTKREVILSAGAILSPFILLSSGIGPGSELKEAGVDVKVDLPGVGKNLQNHWRVPLVHETVCSDMSLHDGLFKRAKESLDQAINTRDGTFTELWPDAVAYMKVPNAPDNSSSIENTPQIELFVGGLALCRELPKLKHVDCATLLMVYVTPFSKGTVKLTKERTPCIDLALLSDERDLECLEKGLKVSMQIADDTEYTKCIKRWIMRPDGDLTEYIKANVDTLHHYAGTCKMGPKEDPFAVVDDRLRVHGIHGLRVVDASFFPIVPAGQICYPVIACAERASDIILRG
ncbi:hypothetical protein EDC94DRAFT_629444 [Helicostylum pulchrum]|uniref:Glucose-methanol-choline oxidoreductase N-terminal domain-containing protein n=1 Tax=Helicostylum pulchrum TaxID=562976 RepID=A0ABP9Y3Y1_9FUNG|nr:hypothetical protein EDC94DRAFT_629444 [Helicostylum pulchrum]